jgi:hypothetical protein
MMAAPTEPLTPEEAGALRELEHTHRRQHRWVALFWSVILSVHTTVILHTLWHEWPLNARYQRRLAFFVVNALGGLTMAAWHLRGVRAHEAEQRRWARQLARWRAQEGARLEPWEDTPGRSGADHRA